MKRLLSLFLLIPFIFSCKEEVRKVDFVRPVKVCQVYSLGYTSAQFSGAVSPDEYSNLAFRTSGPLVSLNVVEGQKVKKGDVIAVMDKSDYKLDYDAKYATYISAKSQFERAEKLIEKDAISKQSFESIKANLENAKAAFENAKQRLDETVLRAPFDGFIQEKFVENYQQVRQGDRIVRLINPNKIQMQATLPEYAVKYFASNPKIFVSFDAYKGVKFKAKIKEYVQASEDGSGIPVYVTIDDPDFSLSKYKVAVGFACNIEFVLEEDENGENSNLVVPLAAVVADFKTSNGEVFVYNPTNNVVNKRRITFGSIIEKDKIIVLSGLKAGEMVVSAGATRLTDGEVVKLLN